MATLIENPAIVIRSSPLLNANPRNRILFGLSITTRERSGSFVNRLHAPGICGILMEIKSDELGNQR
jgi:hypothetical protein